MITVQAIKCPRCEDTIFSRAGHDFRSCTCGGYSIDGGQNYVRCLWNNELNPPECFELEVKATKEQLYKDWNLSKDKFGLIKAKRK